VARKARAPIKGKRYEKHYAELRKRHFLHEEADALAVARSLKYIEIRRMTGSRQLLWNRFLSVNPRMRKGTEKFHNAWVDYVRQWYVKKGFDTFDIHMKRVVSPWTWFDDVSYRLPEELRYTKDDRRKNKSGSTNKESASMRAQKVSWIHQLKETLKREPSRAPQLIPQIMRLGGKVSPELRRKAGIE
jgi:hypothetical protein